MKIKNLITYRILILLLVVWINPQLNAKTVMDSIGFSIKSIEQTNEIVVEIHGIYYRKVDLMIKDRVGIVLYEERISNRPAYRKRMVMDVPTGDYFLTIATENKVLKRTLYMRDGQIEIESLDLTTSVQPKFKQEGERLLVSLTTPSPSKVEVWFADEAGNTFFEDNLVIVRNMERTYNIASLPAGYYEVQLKNEENVYSYNVIFK